jgi:hypothetical protein
VASKPAIFASVGKETCGFRNLVLTMEAGIINRVPGQNGKKGKIIEFGPEGKYETYITEEIEFLKWKEKHSSRFSRIKCIQEPEYKKEEDNDQNRRR